MYRISRFHPKKVLKRRRKIRSLVVKETPEFERSRALQNVGLIMFTLCTLAVTIFALQSMSWTEFLSTYRDQYNLIVHGQKDYCIPILDTRTMFGQINEIVLNQEEALRDIEIQLRNDSKFTAIAVVGRTGVGKTLFAHALQDLFPWQENSHMYSWLNFHTENHKQENVQSFLRYLSECGRNLIIIDNLAPEDLNFIQEYTSNAMKKVERSRANLIVLYLINVATYTEEQRELYDEKFDMIQGIKNVKIVEFKKFGTGELRDCIRQEAKNLNYTLDEEGFREVMTSIDVERSGCKNVHPKVLMYGQLADTFVY